MIVWGGSWSDTGGRYNRDTNSWTAATTTTNAPFSREFHAAVWTGTEMIVWGGLDSNFSHVNTGGRYCAQSGPPITLDARLRRQGGKGFVVLT
jgi:hypothetical protein